MKNCFTNINLALKASSKPLNNYPNGDKQLRVFHKHLWGFSFLLQQQSETSMSIILTPLSVIEIQTALKPPQNPQKSSPRDPRFTLDFEDSRYNPYNGRDYP